MGVEDAAEVTESLRKQAAPRGQAFADRGCLCLQTCPPALSGPSLAFLAGGQAECSGPVSRPGCLELQPPRPSVGTYKSQLDASGVLCRGGPEGLW